VIDAEIRNLQIDVVLLQNFIKQRQETGLNDMQRMVESFAIPAFRVVVNNCNLKNKNQIKVNFPAIDYADDKLKIAVQVTTNASPAKITKTIKAFEKHRPGGSIRSSYDKLYIFGFCKASKETTTPDYCQVIDMSYIINELIDHAKEEEIEAIVTGIRRHDLYKSLHPWTDIECLKIILNCIDRDAIKHRMFSEGSVYDMTKGLKEISELISKGTINKKPKSKCIDDFFDQDIIDFLISTRNHISKITAIVNRSKLPTSDLVWLDQIKLKKIDNIKEEILIESNTISKNKNVGIVLGFTEPDD